MAFKHRSSASGSLTTVGAHTNVEILSNQSGSEPWDDSSLTIVDGQLTVITDSDDLMGIRLIVANELIGTGDINDTSPSAEDDLVWYSWFCARGPLVFRLVSKRTIHPEHKLWVQFWKEQEANATRLSFGLNLMIQPHA